MFHESDDAARYVHRSFVGMIKECCDTIKDEKIKMLTTHTSLSFLKSIFYSSESQDNLINGLNLIMQILMKSGVAANEKSFKKLTLFISFIKEDQIIPVENLLNLIIELDINIQAALLLSIYCHHQNLYDNFIQIERAYEYFQNQNLDQTIIKTILEHGTLNMLLQYVPDNLINSIKIDSYQANQIIDLQLLKFLITRGVIKREELNYLSLSTAAENGNFELLIFFLYEIRVQDQSKNIFVSSAFYFAQEKKYTDAIRTYQKWCL
jgi:hypothetical protein